MAKKEQKQDNKSILWGYIGENQEYVVMTCTREDWNKIIKILEYVRDKKEHYRMAHESDEFNFSYTYSDWKNSKETY